MRITRATLGMAPANYSTTCCQCPTELHKGFDEIFYASGMTGFRTIQTLCKECAAFAALDYLEELTQTETSEATARIIRESRSH